MNIFILSATSSDATVNDNLVNSTAFATLESAKSNAVWAAEAAVDESKVVWTEFEHQGRRAWSWTESDADDSLVFVIREMPIFD